MSDSDTHTSESVRRRLRLLLDELTAAGVPHCVLRNYEGLLPGATYENADLDLLVGSSDAARVDALMRRLGFSDAGRSTAQRHRDYVAYLPSTFALVAVDLHLGAPSWNDIPYFDGRALLSKAVQWNGIAVPAPEHWIPLLAVHAVLDKKGFKPEYEEAIRQTPIDAETARNLLLPFAGGSMADRVAAHLQATDTDGLVRMRRRLILALMGLRAGNWIRALQCVWRSRWRRFRRRWLPFGLVLAIIGPDGSGKSTARGRIEQHLRCRGIGYQSYYMGRWQDQILPLARGARRWGAAAVQNRSGTSLPSTSGDPTVLPGRSLYALLRETLYVVDLTLRYALRILPARLRAPVVIAERYAVDLAVDPSSTPWTDFMLKHFYPKPTTCIYLRGDARTLWERKQEQSPQEIQRQIFSYDRWQSHYRCRTVSAASLRELDDQILSCVVLQAIARS